MMSSCCINCLRLRWEESSAYSFHSFSACIIAPCNIILKILQSTFPRISDVEWDLVALISKITTNLWNCKLPADPSARTKHPFHRNEETGVGATMSSPASEIVVSNEPPPSSPVQTMSKSLEPVEPEEMSLDTPVPPPTDPTSKKSFKRKYSLHC